LEYEVKKVPNGHEIIVRAENFAAFVHLFLADSHAVFSDNFFHLMPGESITLSCNSTLGNEEFNRQIRVQDLRAYLDADIK
jgi:beta-mannosidase